MRSFVVALVVVIAVAPAAGDPADDAAGDGEIDGVVELAHRVTVELEDGAASFQVERRLAHRGRGSARHELSVMLPDGAAATGLALRRKGRWFTGELLDAEAARQRFDDLTTADFTGERHGPALLAWDGLGQLGLSVYPVVAGEPVHLRYRALAPTCYADGWRLVNYPAEEPAPVIDARGGRVIPPGKGLGPEHAGLIEGCGLEDLSDHYRILFRAPAGPPLEADYARVTLPSGKAVTELRVAVAPSLGAAPRGARVVFVVDASRSERPAAIAAQRDLILGYLAAVPDARFEIVVYRRGATRLFGRFVPAARADALLAGLPASAWQRGNGSDLDAGLALATRLLAGERRPARVIAFTDALVPTRMVVAEAERVVRGLPAHAVLHLVDVAADPGADALVRADDHELVALTRPSGGIAANLGHPADAGAARALMLGLVKPLAIDHVRLDGELLADGFDVLAAGDWHRALTVAPGGAPARRELTGMVWGRAIRRALVSSAAGERRAAALLFGAAEHADLDADDTLAAARHGHAVSPATSLLAAVPGARPTGPEEGEMIGSICGCGGSSTSGSIACGGVFGHGGSRVARPSDQQARLARWLEPAYQGCAARHGRAAVALEVETTLDEVVDVVPVSPGSGALAQCVAEAAWELTLDDAFFSHRDTYRVELR